MQDNLRRLVDLAQKTGDTLIVTDKEGQEPVVIMDVAKYEALLDIGLFAEESDISYEDQQEEVAELQDFEPPMEVYAPEIQEDHTEEMVQEASIPHLTPEPQPHPAMDSVIDQGNDDDPGEERFYLEPIEK